MQIQELQEQYPDLYKAVYDKGFKAAKDQMTPDKCDQDCTAKGKKEGAVAESGRIKAVFELGKKKPGHEAIIEGAMFDGKTTMELAAVAIIDAEAGKRQKMAADIAAGLVDKDGKPIVVPGAEGTDAADQKVVKRAQFEAMGVKERADFVKAGGKVVD